MAEIKPMTKDNAQAREAAKNRDFESYEVDLLHREAKKKWIATGLEYSDYDAHCDGFGEGHDKGFDAGLAANAERVWFPTSERLPDEDGGYLVTTKDGYWGEPSKVVVALFEDGEFHGLFRSSDAALAWMPLPEPYKAAEPNKFEKEITMTKTKKICVVKYSSTEYGSGPIITDSVDSERIKIEVDKGARVECFLMDEAEYRRLPVTMEGASFFAAG